MPSEYGSVANLGFQGDIALAVRRADRQSKPQGPHLDLFEQIPQPAPRLTDREKRRMVRRWHIGNWVKYRWREVVLNGILAIRKFVPGLCPIFGTIRVKLIRANGDEVDFGVAGHHLIVTVGKTYVRDAWTNGVELENMKFHGIGTGATAPAAGNTALETESTTAYNPDNTRATGSLTTNGSNVFRTIGTVTVDAAVACTEWGLLSQAATGGGVLFDRQTFSVINLANGDSLQITYDVTIG